MVRILTDGLSTVGIDLNQPGLSPVSAVTIAAATTVPSLPGASVTIAGIGRMAGALPPTSFVDSLKAFYAEACRRTHAECHVVSDLAAGVTL